MECDAKQIRQMLAILFPQLDGDYIEVRLIHTVEKGATAHFYGSVDEALQSAPQWEAAQREGCGVYVGLCSRRIKGNGRRESVSLVRCLWVDIDAKHFQGGKEEALNCLRAFKLPPSILNDSGHGYHALWLLRHPYLIQSESDIERIEQLNRGLAHALNGDNVGDVARVLRLPGTWNLKDRDCLVLAHTLECDATRSYDLAAFDEFAAALPEPAQATRNTTPGWVATLLRALHEGTEDGCHNAFFRLACKLKQGGLQADETLALLAPHVEQVAHADHQYSYSHLCHDVEDVYRRYADNRTPAHSSRGSEVMQLELVDLATLPDPPSRVDLIEGLLPQNFITVLYGDGGTSKSYTALLMSISVLLGQPFLGFPVQQANVLYCDWELEVTEMTRRAYKVARGLGLERLPTGLRYISVTHTLPQVLYAIKQQVALHRIGLVIIDSLGASSAGDPELARIVIPLMADLRQLGTTILVVDHQAKVQAGQLYEQKTPFGSQYKYNLSRSVIQLKRLERPGETCCLLRQTKFSFGSRLDPLGVGLRFEVVNGHQQVRFEVREDLAEVLDETATSEVKILNEFSKTGRGSVRQIAERAGIPEGTVRNCITRLKRLERVREVGKEGHAIIYDVTDMVTGPAPAIITPVQ